MEGQPPHPARILNANPLSLLTPKEQADGYCTNGSLAFPSIKAIVRDNGTAEVVVAGNSRIVPAGESLQGLRKNALALVVGEAQTLQRPVRVRSRIPKATVS